MDNIFARCADCVALAGQKGIELETSVERVLDAPPRPALVNWLHRSFAARPAQFTVHEGEDGDASKVRVVASQGVRERAMGFSLLEHAPVQTQSMQILEAVGQAGQAGVLQSELGPKVDLSPVMVHHYLGALVALKLVARRKVVLTSHKAARIDEPGVRSMHASEEGDHPSTEEPSTAGKPSKKPSGNVTQTAVIVLARFAPHIDTSNAAEKMSTPAGAVPMTNDHPTRAVFNVKAEVRVERVLAALHQSHAGVMPQRDLKLIAIPDNECPKNSPHHKFVRRRHRIFRVVRTRMLKANLVTAVMKECVDIQGKSLGELPCFQLAVPTLASSAVSQPVASVVTAAAAQGDAEMNEDDEILSEDDEGEIIEGNVTADTPTPAAVFELDVAEQVYQSLEISGARGMSCPDVVAYLDGDTGQTGIEYKRTRTLLKSIDKTNPIQNLQHFDGSACHKRFVLKKNHVESGREWPRDDEAPPVTSATQPFGENPVPTPPSLKKTAGRRATNGALTTLGEERKKFVEDLLRDRKVLQLDRIGREVAKTEGRPNPIDSKVIHKVVDVMLASGVCREIEVNKPSLTATRKVSLIRLLVLRGVESNGPEVRAFLSSVVKRSVITNKDSLLPPDAAKYGRKRKSAPETPGKRIRSASISEPLTSALPKEADATTGVVDSALGVHYNPLGLASEPVDAESNFDALLDSYSSAGPDTRFSQAAEATTPVVEPPDTRASEPPVSRASVLLDAYASEPRIVVTAVRAEEDPRVARVAKLRAVEYGWVRPKMQRVRLFHEHLVRHVLGSDFFVGALAGGFDVVEHSTLEAASWTDDLGCFNLQESFMAMTVRQFAVIIGLHQDHGEVDGATFDLAMKDAPERIQAEAKSKTGTGKVRILFSVLLRLGLVQSAEDASWVLRGAGVFRDFGRGIPEGKSSHSIKFASPASIRSYWDELESLANLGAIRSYVPDVSSFALNRKLASNVRGPSEDPPQIHETAQVLDVYVPAAWLPPKSGNLRHKTEDDLRMESVLQTIVSAEAWADDFKFPKDISSWTPGPLPRISVEDLYDNAMLLFPPRDPRRGAIVKHFYIEKLLHYSRRRVSRPASKLVLLLAKSGGPVPLARRVSGGKWISDTIISPAAPRKRKSRSSSLSRKKKQKSDRTKEDAGEEATDETDSELSFGECVQFLIAVTQANALSKLRQQQGLSLTTEESELKFWKRVTDAVQQPVERCKLELQILRKSDFVGRNLDFLCERLVERLVVSDASVVDGSLIEVPMGVYDFLGEEIPIDAAVGSILRESELCFGMKRGEFKLRQAKRKSILDRLRTPSQIPASTATATAEAVQKKQRRRKIAAYVRSPDIHYGMIRRHSSDPAWVSSHAISEASSSVARTAVLSLILKAIFAESEETFAPATALYMLSRFPKTELIATRDELYQQKYVTICDNRRRLFEIASSNRPLETVYGVESLEGIAKAWHSVDSLVRGAGAVSSSRMMKQVCSRDPLVSQSAMCAIVQGLFRECADGVQLKLFSSVRERADIAESPRSTRNTHVIVDFMKLSSATGESVEESRESGGAEVISTPQKPVVGIDAQESSAIEKNESGDTEMVSAPQEQESDAPEKGGAERNENGDVDTEMTSAPQKQGSNPPEKGEERNGNGSAETATAPQKPAIEPSLQESEAPESAKSVRDDATPALTATPKEATDESPVVPLALDAEQMQIEDEWALEIRALRDRETQTIAYYKTQMQHRDSAEDDLPEVMWAVLEIIEQSGTSGVTSVDIGAQASQKGFRGELVVQSVCSLLKEGIIHRFACGDIEKRHSRSAVYFLTSYAWLFVAVPLLKSPARKCWVADWMSARPISPWTRMNGAYNTELVKAVQMHIVSVLARSPGTEEGVLVEKVHWRELALTARAILDAAMAMHRAGILRREVRKTTAGAVSLFGSPQVDWVPEKESLVHRFPDGFELAYTGGELKVFYSLSRARLGHLLEAKDFEMLSQRTPEFN